MIPTQPFSDFAYYHDLAQKIAQGGKWGDTYTAVGYPVFLAFFYALFGPSLWIPKILNLILAVININLVIGILQKLPLPEWGKRAACIVFTLFPLNIYYNSIVATEVLFTTLLLVIVNLYFSAWRYRYPAIGLFIGLNSLIKPFFPAFVLVILLAEVVYRTTPIVLVKRVALVILLSLVVIAPWLYRNHQLIGEFTYISNNGGIVLYINNNSQNHTAGWMPAEEVADSIVKQADYQAANATQQNKMLSQAAKQWIFDHPGEFIQLGWKRIVRTFLLTTDIYYSLQGVSLPYTFHLVLASTANLLNGIFSWTGFWTSIGWSVVLFCRYVRNWRAPNISQNETFLLLIFWMFFGIYFITEGQVRYEYPLIFILVYFSCRLLSVFRYFSQPGKKPLN